MELIRGLFLERLNRFVLKCLVDGKEVPAYLPNPGRLIEILLPETPLYLKPKTANSGYPFVVYGAEKSGRVVMLHTHHTNRVAQWLIQRELVPELKGYKIKAAEVRRGGSRFDFLLSGRRGELLLEVKSCTLFHRGIAMFPDAPTERGRRHIKELAESGMGAVLFVVHDPQAKVFVPDYHTDPEFASTLYSMRDKIQVLAVSVGWNEKMEPAKKVRPLRVGLEPIGRELKDRGYYAVVLRVERDRVVEVGSLGRIEFPAGFYVYIGSAKRGLSGRIKRHLRLRKRLHWHIDYLRTASVVVYSFPIRSSVSRECKLAHTVKRISDWQIKGFGSGDCSCSGHLFGFRRNPLQNREFINIMLDFRVMEIDRVLNRI